MGSVRRTGEHVARVNWYIGGVFRFEENGKVFYMGQVCHHPARLKAAGFGTSRKKVDVNIHGKRKR
jgi:hypothetical protein